MRPNRFAFAALAVLLFLGLAGGAEAAGRRLVVNDQLQVRVINQPELDSQLRVAPDGTVTFPYVGRIRAAGMSEDQLASSIRQGLEKADIVKSGQVQVTLIGFGSQAMVGGAVRTPGPVQLERPMTLAGAIAAAGGVPENAGDVVLKRQAGRGQSVLRFNAKDVLEGKVKTIFLQNFDEVFVESSPIFFLYGYVGRPGQYNLSRPMTVQQALAVGGGITELGSDWRMQVKRSTSNGQLEVRSIGLDDVVMPNDTIIVRERLF